MSQLVRPPAAPAGPAAGARTVSVKDASALRSALLDTARDVVVQLPKPRRDVELETTNGELPLEILYEDRWLVAVDKPPGIPVHPASLSAWK